MISRSPCGPGAAHPEIDWSHSASDAPLRERLASLDFLYALSGEGEIRFESIDPPLAEPLTLLAVGWEFDELFSFERRLFEALVLIEDYLRTGFELPEEIGEQEVGAIFTAAETIRTRAARVRIDRVAFEVAGGALVEGDEIELRGPIPVDITIFGDKLNLGVADGTLIGRIDEIGRNGDMDQVTVVPRDSEAASIAVTALRRPSSLSLEDGEDEGP